MNNQPEIFYLDIVSDLNDDRSIPDNLISYLIIRQTFSHLCSHENNILSDFFADRKIDKNYPLQEGTKLSLKEKKMIILPCENNLENYTITQELINKNDVDYYLFTYVNREENLLEIIGGLSSEQILQNKVNSHQDFYLIPKANLFSFSAILIDVQHYPLVIPTVTVPEAIEALDNQDSQVRENAVIALEKIGDETAIEALNSLVARETVVNIREMAENILAKISPTVTNLTNWLDNLFENSWLERENLGILAGAFEKKIERGKAIELTIDFPDYSTTQTIILLVTVQYDEDQPTTGIDVSFEVYPAEGQQYLPANLMMQTWLDNPEQIEQELISQEDSFFLQMGFEECEQGDRFGVNLVLGNQRVTETFMI